MRSKVQRVFRQLLKWLLAGSIMLAAAGCATPPPWGEFPMRTLPAEWVPEWRKAASGIDYAYRSGGTLPPFHVVRVDLEVAAVTLPPPFPQGREAADLLREYSDVLGIVNGTPFRVHRTSGERRMEPVGVWIAGGRRYSRQEEQWGVLWYDARAKRARVTKGWSRGTPARWAAGGFLPIVEEGKNVGIHGERHARLAAGTAREGTLLYFLMIEGEELGQQGATSRETAQVMLRLGVQEALNLDGGRSATLLLSDASGTFLAQAESGRKSLPCFILLRSGGQ